MSGRRIAAQLAAVVAAAGLIVVAVLLATPGRHAPALPRTRHPLARAVTVGVAAIPASQVPAFGRETGTRPGIVEVYRTFGTPLATVHAARIIGGGAEPFIQLDPYRIPLATITAGRYDAYLTRYARQIRQLHHQVALSFAPEANGPWYAWGCHHTAAAVYIAAWRHVHDVMTAAAGGAIRWVWDINRASPGMCPVAARWPGARYVDEVGIDAYWRRLGDTWATAIAPLIRQVREFTAAPVLIAESGAPDVPQAAGWITGLFAGARATPRVTGIVYFDYDGRADYRLADDPAALAAFRRAARR
jgi:mannan endo-1,4-beta-mannosidase